MVGAIGFGEVPDSWAHLRSGSVRGLDLRQESAVPVTDALATVTRVVFGALAAG